MREWINLFEEVSGLMTLYHITDKPKFKLNPDIEPQDNAVSISSREGNKGIYATRDIEPWVNGKGYIRPFVAELLVDPSALQHDAVSRWGNEVFIPASQFDKVKISRVVPLDAIARETYGLHGWIETSHGSEFDSGNEITAKGWEQPFKDYRYPHDVREMSREEILQYRKRFNAGYRARNKERG